MGGLLMSKSNGVIDWSKWGTLLKAARIANGFMRGSALADEVRERTGMSISERMVYALESADRTPSADIFLALQQVLPELRDPDFIRPAFKQSNIDVAVISL